MRNEVLQFYVEFLSKVTDKYGQFEVSLTSLSMQGINANSEPWDDSTDYLINEDEFELIKKGLEMKGYEVNIDKDNLIKVIKKRA